MVKIFYSFLWILFIYSSIFLSYYTPQWLSSPEKSIDFFCWGDVLEPELIAEFEEEFNIKVRIHPFTCNEEMLVKLKTVNGNGYDLICASDYAIKQLQKEKLIQPLQKDLIPNIKNIHPHFLNLFYDPLNTYSLPVEWEPYVFVSRSHQKLRIADLFSLPDNQKIVMTSDPIEAIAYAAYTLFGKTENLSKQQLSLVSDLLKKQKKNVEAYADHRARYLLETQNCDIGLIRSGFARSMQKNEIPIHYHLPLDWKFVNIENLAIVKNAVNEKEAHLLINFILSKECQKKHSESSMIFSVRKDILEEIPSPIVTEFLDAQEPEFFKYLCAEEDARDLWVSLKSYTPNQN